VTAVQKIVATAFAKPVMNANKPVPLALGIATVARILAKTIFVKEPAAVAEKVQFVHSTVIAALTLAVAASVRRMVAVAQILMAHACGIAIVVRMTAAIMSVADPGVVLAKGLRAHSIVTAVQKVAVAENVRKMAAAVRTSVAHARGTAIVVLKIAKIRFVLEPGVAAQKDPCAILQVIAALRCASRAFARRAAAKAEKLVL